MDKRITRFKLCDYRFYPYLEKVLERLPGEVKEDVLNNKTLEILSDEDILEAYVSQNEFDNPIKTLLYLNAKILKEPDHRIIHTIAHEIANYVLRDGETVFYEKEAEDLLINWGFEEEVHAVRYDQAMAKSEGYKLGYEWAKKQDKEYLLQHFGLYFDEWNDKGLGIMSDVNQYKKQYTVEDEETFSLRETVIAGIMIALKEMELHDSYSSKN